ncbi:MAG: hypothetical protein EHM91_03610 [Planctomycetota bacterium]|nr:MAG: hypothetical protein EHM91_03610 [Planctomycetota bacterium]
MPLAPSLPMDFLPDGWFNRGVMGGIMFGMMFFVLVCLHRAFNRIRTFGLWNYLASALKIEDDSLGLLLGLLLVLLATILVFGVEPLRFAVP